jgi:hypothetical protein
MRKKSTSPTRICPNCEIEYDRAKYGHFRVCYPCHRDSELQRKFNITLAAWAQVLEDQAGGCAMCGVQPASARKGFLVTDGDEDLRCFYAIVCLDCLNCARAERIYRDNPEFRLRAIAHINSQSSS